MSDRNTTPQTAVWYFVAATFIFTAPNLYFRDSPSPWLFPVTLAVGFAVVACGIVVLSAEHRQARDARTRLAGEAVSRPGGTRDESAATSLHTPLLGLAACLTAILAVIGCVVTVVLQLPLAAELTIIFASVLLLAASGAMIGMVISRGRGQTP